MTFGIFAACISALGISLLLIARQHGSAAVRAGTAFPQIAIWGLVWTLVNPPALLPAEKTAAAAMALPRDREELLQLSPDELATAGELEVTGDGLPRDALRDLPPVRLRLGAASDAPGWQVDWPRQLALGEALQLRISQETGTAARIILEDPFGGDVDKAILSAKNPKVILTDTPKLAGRWLYHVRIETETDSETDVRREPLPLQVHPAEAPRILLWLAKPGFESAALSRWLRQSGTPTRVITQLAPELVRLESFNGLNTTTEDPLDPQAPFDLVILDSHLWPQLSRAQRQRLPLLAEEKSLLWLVGPDSPRGFLDYASARGMALAPEDSREVNYPAAGAPADGGEERPALILTGYRPQQVRPGDTRLGEEPIYWARSHSGQSLGFALFGGSYRWITAGHAADFSRLWKTLFDHQLAHRGGRASVKLQSSLPRARHRLSLCSADFSGVEPQLIDLESDATEAPQAGVALPGGGDTCYSWWPRRAGWHRVDYGGGEYHFHVFPDDAWPQWQRATARADTRQMASARLGPRLDMEMRSKPIPRQWIALALILLLAFVWCRERRWLR